MSDKVTGGCHCGAVRYECSAAPLKAGHCQCSNCQKFSGTGHASNVMLLKEAFSSTGDVSLYEYQAESGNTMTRAFCKKCGTPVYGTSSGNEKVVMIRAGGLDDPTLFDPAFVLFTGKGLPWDTVDPEIPSFPGMPG